jgi:hypothetical protein
MIEIFKNGGFGMFPTALFGLVLLAVSARYAVRPDKPMVPLQLALGILTLATGALGFVTGLITTTKHLWELPADRMGLVAAVGLGESLHNLALVALGALAACVGAARIARRPGEEAA